MPKYKFIKELGKGACGEVIEVVVRNQIIKVM